MKNKKLLPIVLLSAMMLGACGGSNSSSQSSQETSSQETSSQETSSQEASSEESSESVRYGVALNNAEELGAELRVGDHRDLDIALTPEGNVQLEINKGNLVIASSDATIVSVTGAAISALAEGTATITITYHDASTSVELEVLPKLTPKVKYGTVHEGTEADPFDNEDAITVGKFIKASGETATAETDLYIKGVVTSFYHAPGSRTDGAVSFYLEPATEDGEQFEIYKCYKADEKGNSVALTDDDIWKGAEVLAHGPITFYNDQMETSYAWFDRVTGGDPKPEAPKEIEATVAEALTVGKALTDGDSTWDYYVVTGYVVRKSGTNYFLADTQTVEDSVDNKDLLELYYVSEEDQGKLLQGAQVKVKMKLKNYHGQIENGSTMEITVLQEGQKWSNPEPSVVTKTLAEFIALDASDNGKHAYYVTAEVKALKDGSTADEYGNMTLTDGTNDLIIYGSTATETALAWDGSESYGFTNPKDFLTNDVTKAIVVGDTVKMKLIRADYKETIQGKGVILEVNPGEEPPVVVDYGSLEKPLTVATLLGDDGTICAQVNGSFSAQKVIVKGKLSGASYNDSYGTYTGYLVDLEDSSKKIKFTGVELSEEVAAKVASNDTVTLEHYLEYYNGGYSLYYQKANDVYDYGDFLRRDVIGTSTITVEKDEHVEAVTGLEETYTNDATASFTVTVAEGYEIDTVKVNNAEIEATEGTYSFTVAGDMTVAIATIEKGAVKTTMELTVDSLNLPTSYADAEATVDGVTFSTNQVANYGDGMQFRYKNSKASEFHNTTALSYGIASIVITFNAKQTSTKGLMYAAFGDAEVTATEGTGFVWAEDATTVTITPDVNTYTFFKIGHTTTSGSAYIDSVVVNYAIA